MTPMPVSAALIAVLSLAVVAFIIGYLFGEVAGAKAARVKAFHQLLDWSAMAMKRNPVWCYLSADHALSRAACLIGGNDVMPPVPESTTPRPHFTKGNQA